MSSDGTPAMIARIYLAGPDVFLPDAVEVGRAKVALCRRYGLEGLFPLDNDPGRTGSPQQRGLAIYRANLAAMRRADAIVANVSPFRGASADVGTAFELGWFASTDKPIFAYSSDVRSLAARTRDRLGLAVDAAVDPDGWTVEDFDLPDNLMLPGAVASAGGAWIGRAARAGGELVAMEAFEQCLRAVRALNDRIPRAAAR